VIRITGRDDLHRIVVLNPKGGCGKTTLSTNLAGALAVRGSPPTLLDCDPQGYGTTWVEKRPAELPEVYGIRCYDDESGSVPRSLFVQIPEDSHTVIVDMPAAIPRNRLYEYTNLGDTLLIPTVAQSSGGQAGPRRERSSKQTTPRLTARLNRARSPSPLRRTS
jgi:chromosome partitioning protein